MLERQLHLHRAFHPFIHPPVHPSIPRQSPPKKNRLLGFAFVPTQSSPIAAGSTAHRLAGPVSPVIFHFSVAAPCPSLPYLTAALPQLSEILEIMFIPSGPRRRHPSSDVLAIRHLSVSRFPLSVLRHACPSCLAATVQHAQLLEQASSSTNSGRPSL